MSKETLKITKIFRGKQATKFGEKDKVGIKTDKYGETWVSSFQTKGTEGWKEGDTVEVYIEKKGDYVNFTLAPKVADVSSLEQRIKALEDKVFGNPRAENTIVRDEPVADPDDF